MPNLASVLKGLQAEKRNVESELERLDKAISVLGQLTGSGSSRRSGRRGDKRHLSPAARKRIAAAQRARWAKWKKQHAKKA
jgi:hypothetical protein